MSYWTKVTGFSGQRESKSIMTPPKTYAQKISVLHVLIASSLGISVSQVQDAYASQGDPRLSKNQVEFHVSPDILSALGGDVDGDAMMVCFCPTIGSGVWVDLTPNGGFYIPGPDESITLSMLVSIDKYKRIARYEVAMDTRKADTPQGQYAPLRGYVHPLTSGEMVTQSLSQEIDWRTLRDLFWAKAQGDPTLMRDYQEQVAGTPYQEV